MLIVIVTQFIGRLFHYYGIHINLFLFVRSIFTCPHSILHNDMLGLILNKHEGGFNE